MSLQNQRSDLRIRNSETIVRGVKRRQGTRTGVDNVSESLINITDSAADAFKGIDLPSDGPQAIRLYFQGFG